MRASFGPNRANAVLLLYSTPVFVLLSLFFLLFGLGRDYVSDKLAFAGIGCFTLLLGVGTFIGYRGQLKMSAEVYADGFVFTNWRGRSDVFRWDEIVEVYEFVNKHREAGGRVTRTYTVCRTGGQRARLNTAIQDVERLGRVIQTETRRRLLPRAIAAYRAGETVAFGPKIGLNRRGLISGHRTLPWSQVSEIRFSRAGDVWIGQEERRAAWQFVLHARVANYSVLRTMVKRVIDLDLQGEQPIVDDQSSF
jgi:hypothetical protein